MFNNIYIVRFKKLPINDMPCRHPVVFLTHFKYNTIILFRHKIIILTITVMLNVKPAVGYKQFIALYPTSASSRDDTTL